MVARQLKKRFQTHQAAARRQCNGVGFGSPFFLRFTFLHYKELYTRLSDLCMLAIRNERQNLSTTVIDVQRPWII